MFSRLPTDLIEVVFDLCGPISVAYALSKSLHASALVASLRTLERTEKRRGKASTDERAALDLVYDHVDVMNYTPRRGYPAVGQHFVSGISSAMAQWLIAAWFRVVNHRVCHRVAHPGGRCSRYKHKRKTFLLYPVDPKRLENLKHECCRALCCQPTGLGLLMETDATKMHIFGVEYTGTFRNEFNERKTGQIDGVLLDDKRTYFEFNLGHAVFSRKGVWSFRFEKFDLSPFHLRQCFTPHQLTFYAFRKYECFSITPLIRKLRSHMKSVGVI